MTYDPKVSLVFACWHAVQHMPHVLEDLQAQTFKDFETILVSDGDDSQLAAMEAIAAKDNRIRIMRLEKNSGTAAARNAGMDAVTTEWVTYPDQDDRLGPNYVRNLFEAVDGKNVEMACGGFRRIKVDTGETLFFYPNVDYSPKIMDMAEGYERMFEPNIQGYVWNKLYNVKILRKYGLQQDARFIVCQDHQLNLRYFSKVKKIGMIKDCDYIWLQYHTGSQQTSSYNPSSMQQWQEITGLSVHYHRQIGWSEEKVEKDRKFRTLTGIGIMLKNLFFYDANLSIKEATAELQKDFFDHPEYVTLVKQWHCEVKHFVWMLQLLLRMNCSARTTAIFFRSLGKITRILNISIP